MHLPWRLSLTVRFDKGPTISSSIWERFDGGVSKYSSFSLSESELNILGHLKRKPKKRQKRIVWGQIQSGSTTPPRIDKCWSVKLMRTHSGHEWLSRGNLCMKCKLGTTPLQVLFIANSISKLDTLILKPYTTHAVFVIGNWITFWALIASLLYFTLMFCKTNLDVSLPKYKVQNKQPYISKKHHLTNVMLTVMHQNKLEAQIKS